MADSSRSHQDVHPALMHVMLPVVLLFIVIALVSGLVFGGVLQGHSERVGPGGPTTSQPTILIEP